MHKLFASLRFTFLLALVAIATTAGAQNTINGHEYVDLGLPSGLLWATCNVGATKPEEYGDYFAWGETQKKGNYSWETYKWCEGAYHKLTKYCNNSIYGNNGFTDNLTTLEAEDDAAAVNWKGGWRMPTRADFQELLTNTTNEEVTVNGVKGFKFTSKTNDNSIFLPVAEWADGTSIGDGNSNGYYWASSLSAASAAYILSLISADEPNNIHSEVSLVAITGNRYIGHSVRPVNENKTKIEAQCQPAEGGTVEGTGLYAVGSKATLTAKPNKGYKFVKWTTLSGTWQGAETTLTVNVPWTATGGSTWIAVFEKETTDPKTLAVTFTKATTLLTELSNEDKLVLAAVVVLAQKGKLDGYSVGIDPHEKGVVTLKKGTKTLFVFDNNKGITVPSGVSSADNINVTLTDNLRQALTTDLATQLASYDAIQIKFDISTPDVAVTGVSLSPTTKELKVGEKFTLVAQITPSNATNQNVTWISNDATVATVSNGEVTAEGVGTATITVTTVDGNKTATCEVTISAAAATTYALTIVSPTNGTLTASPSGYISEGTEVTLTATPASGYKLKALKAYKTGEPSTTVAINGNKFNMPAYEVTVEAEFEKTSSGGGGSTTYYTLSYTAGEGGSIKGATMQTVVQGGSGQEVEAVPSSGYVFKKWSDGLTTAKRTDYNVQGNLTVTAEFEKSNTTGIFDTKLDALSVYPNPTQGVLWVSVPELAEGTTAEMHVYNANGQLLQRVPAHGASAGSAASRLSIDLSGYPDGLYIIRVGNAVAKVVKQ